MRSRTRKRDIAAFAASVIVLVAALPVAWVVRLVWSANASHRLFRESPCEDMSYDRAPGYYYLGLCELMGSSPGFSGKPLPSVARIEVDVDETPLHPCPEISVARCTILAASRVWQPVIIGSARAGTYRYDIRLKPERADGEWPLDLDVVLDYGASRSVIRVHEIDIAATDPQFGGRPIYISAGTFTMGDSRCTPVARTRADCSVPPLEKWYWMGCQVPERGHGANFRDVLFSKPPAICYYRAPFAGDRNALLIAAWSPGAVTSSSIRIEWPDNPNPKIGGYQKLDSLLKAGLRYVIPSSGMLVTLRDRTDGALRAAHAPFQKRETPHPGVQAGRQADSDPQAGGPQ